MRFINRSLKFDNLLRVLLFFLTLGWIPLAFIGFDSHHDGLILSTVQFLKDNLNNGGSWHFNQYGPFWAFPFAFVSLLLPSNFVFLGLRLFTILLYALSTYLLFKLAQRFLSKSASIVTSLVFLLSQPFYSKYGSDLVPWPSAICMPIILLQALLLTRMELSENHRKKYISYYLAGFLNFAIIFSRIQIGLLIVILISSLFYITKNKIEFRTFMIGTIVGIAAFVTYLQLNGWLIQALKDQIIFGSSYLRGDTSTYPEPIFTLIGTAMIFLLFQFFPSLENLRVLKRLNISSSSVLTIIIFISILFSHILLIDRNLDFAAEISVISRRFWITATLAALGFYAFGITKKLLLNRRLGRMLSDSLLNEILLLSIALASESQIYPLFDQMHFWWGSVPACLVLVLVAKERIFLTSLDISYRSKNKFLILILALSTVAIPFVQQIRGNYYGMPKMTLAGISAPLEVANKQEVLQRFFEKNLSMNDKVLNLCSDSDVFFSGEYRSASNAFVFWPPAFVNDRNIYNSILDSNPSVIITCSLNQVAKFQKAGEFEQTKIVAKFINKKSKSIGIEDGFGKSWKIYRL